MRCLPVVFMVLVCRVAVAQVQPMLLPIQPGLARAADEMAAAQKLVLSDNVLLMPNFCTVIYPEPIAVDGKTAPSAEQNFYFTARVAIDVAIIRRQLPQAGYPTDIVDRAIALLLSDIARPPAETNESLTDARGDLVPPAYQRFITFLSNYARSSNQRLPALAVGGNCGAGELPVQFITDPPGARAFFIPRFYFQVCERSGVDPFDRRLCVHWVEIPARRKAWLSGRYVYALEWPNGAVWRAEMPVEATGDDPDKAEVIVLRANR